MSVWLKAIRIKFVLASVIAVSNGLALSYLFYKSLNIYYALLTYIGIVALHISVDLLNDYYDYVRGIDKLTKRTGFSGGSGVLPEGLLRPESVYRVGISMLIIGSSIGLYFVLIKGIVIAIILTFAVVSIYFYSSKIVNLGLGELFVAIKGCMIVLGTFYLQTNTINSTVIFVGIMMGILSSTVLFVNSFPDHDADKSKGRRTLVILLGKERASRLFIIFPTLLCSILLIGVTLKILPFPTLLALLSFPMIINPIKRLNRFMDVDLYTMRDTAIFSRLFGVALLLGFIIHIVYHL